MAAGPMVGNALQTTAVAVHLSELNSNEQSRFAPVLSTVAPGSVLRSLSFSEYANIGPKRQ